MRACINVPLWSWEHTCRKWGRIRPTCSKPQSNQAIVKPPNSTSRPFALAFRPSFRRFCVPSFPSPPCSCGGSRQKKSEAGAWTAQPKKDIEEAKTVSMEKIPWAPWAVNRKILFPILQIRNYRAANCQHVNSYLVSASRVKFQRNQGIPPLASHILGLACAAWCPGEM